MKYIIVSVAAALCIALVSSHPVPGEEQLQSKVLDRLVMVEGDNEAALRSKRTIGILRQLFPGVTQIIEQKVNAITAEVFRVLGPIVLRSVLGNTNNAGGTTSSSNRAGSTVTVKSPFDDEDEEETNNDAESSNSDGSKVAVSFPTFPPDEQMEKKEDTEQAVTSTTETNKTSSSSQPVTENGITSTIETIIATEANAKSSANASSGTIADNEISSSTSETSVTTTTATGSSSTEVSQGTTDGTTTDVNPEAEDRVNEVAAESQNNEVRVQFADEQSNDASPPELTPLDEIETNDDENRNKRFLNFGFGGAASGDAGGSGAGSGNFLFNIIRQAADGAARAAGTVYRVVAGTQSLGLGLSATRDLGPVTQDAAPAAAPGDSSTTSGASSTTAPAAGTFGNLPPLVAGSGSQQGNSSGSATGGRTDPVPEAVPGPITRLFVIANRGISNLIQDLILRLAATSERIVNFKARLITSII